MNIDDLLKYQELELAILDIERKLNDTPEFKTYMQCNQLVRQTTQNLSELEIEAERLIKETDNSESLIKDNAEKISTSKALINTIVELEELDLLEKKLIEYNKILQKADTDLSNASQRAYTIMAEAQKSLERLKDASEKGKIAGAKSREIKAKLEKETIPYKEELAEVKEKLPKYALELYANAKKHNKIRWIAQRENGYCIGCGQNVELETAQKIEELGIADCPRCFRVLYIK